MLPPVTLLEDLWGTELDEETLSDLSQLWEGRDPRKLNLAGFRTRTYRESGATPGGTSAAPAGGYVALTLFTSTEDAAKFAATTRVFRAEDVSDSSSYGEPIDLGAFAHEGVGYTYTEDGDDVFGVAYLRMDRMIVEIALLGQPERDYPADLEAVVGFIRQAVDRAPG